MRILKKSYEKYSFFLNYLIIYSIDSLFIYLFLLIINNRTPQLLRMMLNFQGISILVLIAIVAPIISVAQSDQAHDKIKIAQEDLIRIHESQKLIEYSGVKQSDLAPNSKVVSIYFDTAAISLNYSPKPVVVKVVNETKQSQDFDTQSKPEELPSSTFTSLTTTAKPSDDDQPGQVATTITQQPPTTTSSPTTAMVTPTTQEPEAPVASKTVRHGSAVFCGEANPNGKSNKKLVLDRIVGGRKTEPGEFPFQVRLNIRSRRGSGICGGVILDERHILTAAHCMTACVSQYLTTATIENTGVHATIGDHSIRANDGEVEIDIAKIVPHEKYDACNFYANDHDIALITTTEPIDFKFTSDGYGSINRPCMPKSSDVAYKDGEPVIVSGWGVTRENSGSLSNILRYVQVPIVNVTRCQETYGSRVTDDHVCAGYQSGGKDSCQGDSGGPLVRVIDNKYELVGIVSFGYGCGQPGAPGVYTRVASYIDWIKVNL